MGTELATLERVDLMLSEHQIASLDMKKRLTQAVLQARVVRELATALTPAIMEELMPLAGTSLGFRTDKQYPIETVKACVIEAALRGASIIGNEFNIIAGNCYLTRNYFTRQLCIYPGLTDLVVLPGIPRAKPDGALVDVRASWKLNGKSYSMECVGDQAIPCRVNSGQGVDAILGKADRKMKARIFAQITGTQHGDGEVDESNMKQAIGTTIDDTPRTPQSSNTEALKARMEAAVETPAESIPEPLPATPQPERPKATKKKTATPAPAPVPAPEPIAETTAPAEVEETKPEHKSNWSVIQGENNLSNIELPAATEHKEKTAAAAPVATKKELDVSKMTKDELKTYVMSNYAPAVAPKDGEPFKGFVEPHSVKRMDDHAKKLFFFKMVDANATEYAICDSKMAYAIHGILPADKTKGPFKKIIVTGVTSGDYIWVSGVDTDPKVPEELQNEPGSDDGDDLGEEHDPSGEEPSQEQGT